MTNEQIARIEDALRRITPGHWMIDGRYQGMHNIGAGEDNILTPVCQHARYHDAYLMINARIWLEDLIAAHKRQAEEIEALKAEVRIWKL